MSHVRLAQRASDVLDGTLAYISPEKTGRMNRMVDVRSDLYSLGVTLYELLTGRLPFDFADTMELVHAHIARPPAAPDHFRQDIPQLLSAMLLRLLSKKAENRYQSAEGLAADLSDCRRELDRTWIRRERKRLRVDRTRQTGSGNSRRFDRSRPARGCKQFWL